MRLYPDAMSHGEERNEELIRVTCNGTGDTAYAASPAAAIYAATILNQDALTVPGYRTFTFTNNVTGERIAVVDGAELWLAAKGL